VIENNHFAEFTDSDKMWRGAPLVDRALAYGLHSAERIDGNDVRAVRATAESAIAGCRAGTGPCLIEAMTYRMHGHYEGDPAAYQDDDHFAIWQARDPLASALGTLQEAGRGGEGQEAIDAAEHEMDRAKEQGLAAPYPDADTLLVDVYA
jgi:TPP-dependent pyruvate/acetoin dehydrogenase alpha subunit